MDTVTISRKEYQSLRDKVDELDAVQSVLRSVEDAKAVRIHRVF